MSFVRIVGTLLIFGMLSFEIQLFALFQNLLVPLNNLRPPLLSKNEASIRRSTITPTATFQRQSLPGGILNWFKEMSLSLPTPFS